MLLHVLLSAIAISYLLSSGLQPLLTRPILELVEAARVVTSTKDYSIRVKKVSDDEVGQLSEAMNDMLTQIELRDAMLRNVNVQLKRRVESGELLLQHEVSERELTQQALRQSEEQLRQSQKMEAVGQLAGGVAQDFNNVMTAITGHAQLMLMRIGSDDPLYSNAQEILKASSRATNLTQQLLMYVAHLRRS